MKAVRKQLEVEFIILEVVDGIHQIGDSKVVTHRPGVYRVRLPDGRVESLTPEEFAKEYDIVEEPVIGPAEEV